MEKKNILIIILVVLVGSSALLLYRGFSSEPLAIVTPTVSQEDVVVKDQVDAVKRKINKAIGKIDTGGSLDQLMQSPQFQALMTDAIKSITIGAVGRSNPFVPPRLSSETSEGQVVND